MGHSETVYQKWQFCLYPGSETGLIYFSNSSKMPICASLLPQHLSSAKLAHIRPLLFPITFVDQTVSAFLPLNPSTPDCLPQGRYDQVLWRLSKLSLIGLCRFCVLVFWTQKLTPTTNIHATCLQCKVWKQKCFTQQPAGNMSWGMQAGLAIATMRTIAILGGLHLQREEGERVDAVSPPLPGRTLAPSCF